LKAALRGPRVTARVLKAALRGPRVTARVLKATLRGPRILKVTAGILKVALRVLVVALSRRATLPAWVIAIAPGASWTSPAREILAARAGALKWARTALLA
jgi:hypothetical protein